MQPYEIGIQEDPYTAIVSEDFLVERSPIPPAQLFPFNNYVRGQAEADIAQRVHKTKISIVCLWRQDSTEAILFIKAQHHRVADLTTTSLVQVQSLDLAVNLCLNTATNRFVKTDLNPQPGPVRLTGSNENFSTQSRRLLQLQ